MLVKQSKDLLHEALPLVNRLGWQGSIVEVLRKHNMSDQGSSLFTKDDLVKYHYAHQLEKLSKHTPHEPAGFPRLRELLLYRLIECNKAIGPQRLREAIKLSLGTSPLSTPFTCLSETSDELWYRAGDRSTDTTWYTRRGSLLGVYAACEAFQARDLSRGFRDTKALVNNLVGKLETAEYVENSVGQWLDFNARSVFNVARTWR